MPISSVCYIHLECPRGHFCLPAPLGTPRLLLQAHKRCHAPCLMGTGVTCVSMAVRSICINRKLGISECCRTHDHHHQHHHQHHHHHHHCYFTIDSSSFIICLMPSTSAHFIYHSLVLAIATAIKQYNSINDKCYTD